MAIFESKNIDVRTHSLFTTGSYPTSQIMAKANSATNRWMSKCKKSKKLVLAITDNLGYAKKSDGDVVILLSEKNETVPEKITTCTGAQFEATLTKKLFQDYPPSV